MGTALTGSSVASTYDALLKITDNGPVGGTAKVVTDGLGNDSCFKLGTTSAEFTGALGLDAGTVAAPGLYLEGEMGTGLYRIGANNHGYAVSGSKVLDIASTGLSVTGTFSTTSTVSFGGAATLKTDSIVSASGANANFAIESAGGSGRQWVQSSRTDGTYKIRDATGGNDIVSVATTGLSVTGTIVGSSTIETSAGVAWGLGAANSVSPTSPNRTLTVTVAGTTYYVHAKTTND